MRADCIVAGGVCGVLDELGPAEVAPETHALNLTKVQRQFAPEVLHLRTAFKGLLFALCAAACFPLLLLSWLWVSRQLLRHGLLYIAACCLPCTLLYFPQTGTVT